ncbi:universal stress protein [Arthrobacter sp. lap29]|uniref:universal stress protein n=1 Tax=Arthrobacter sp. lap29 TaxID=3056122 RepID=UPI0028F72AE4|nr:universal stress protein [Arthrobacter sp. lap29]
MSTLKEPVTIIVGVDGSESSIAALREAVRLARPLGAQVKALTCWNYPSAYTVPYALGNFGFKEAAQKILDGAVESAFGLDWPRNLTTQLVQGSARPTLIEASRDAALLVLGRRGFGGFKGLLMGSVSSACTAHAHCPVMIVHTADEQGGTV